MHTFLRVIGVLPDQETSLRLRSRATRRIYSCVAVLRGVYAVRFVRARVHKSRMARSRIAAMNALSDVYAMGGRPVVAVNLLGWPRGVLPFELATETPRGGLDVCVSAGCHLAGGHSVNDPEPKCALAVTGIADPNRLLCNDSGKPRTPLSLTKPMRIGVLNFRHKVTGERFPEAMAVMTTLTAGAALAVGVECAADVTVSGRWGSVTSWRGPAASRR
jgi:selenium donor protein